LKAALAVEPDQLLHAEGSAHASSALPSVAEHAYGTPVTRDLQDEVEPLLSLGSCFQVITRRERVFEESGQRRRRRRLYRTSHIRALVPSNRVQPFAALRRTALTKFMRIVELRNALPPSVHDKATSTGLLLLARDFAAYGAAIVGLVYADGWLLGPLWLLAMFSSSGLFILGHDAAHGSLFASARANRIVARIALLPALHGVGAWSLGHNRIHHGHTTREAMDFVWHPLGPEQYTALSLPSKLMHRIKWSWLGAGIYYAHEVWWQKLVRFTFARDAGPALRRDRWLLLVVAATWSGALAWLGLVHYGDAAGATWMWFKAFAVPFFLLQHSLGFVVYVHHIAPDIAWHRRRSWTPVAGQVHGTTVFHVPGWLNAFYHDIFVHLPHHLDTAIPCYRLREALTALQMRYPELGNARRFGFAEYLRITRECKLFDFDAARWCSYAEATSARRT
jgi:acyl-lipid omega-6 desaturase (Delta-12 desaturase)